MSSQHTQVRLTVFVDPRQGSGTTAFEQYAEGNNGAQFDINIVDQRGGLVATVPAAGKSGYSKVRAHDQARRLVACWNACEGVTTDDLEAMPAAYMLTKLQMVIPLFQEARDALTAITEAQRKLHGISPTLADRMDEAGTFSVDDWRAAIAKVKGGAA